MSIWEKANAYLWLRYALAFAYHIYFHYKYF